MGPNWVGIGVIFVLVTVWHEMGHLFAAKWLGISVRRIGIGFGPTLWRSPNLGDTEFVLRALPLGMSIGVSGRRDELGRMRRPIAHDIWMAAGGPLASFLLPTILFIVIRLFAFEPIAIEWIIAAGLLSAILGALNLIPWPGLDGGHLLMLTIARAGWQFSPHLEMRINRVGMQFLLVACILSCVIQLWQWLNT